MINKIDTVRHGVFGILRTLHWLVVSSFILGMSAPAAAANYPLELVSPRAAGTAPSSAAGTPAIPATHRIFKAYPGIEYNIRAAVVGGSYPFTFALTNAPTGMTINARTGEITWTNPQTTSTPTITVTDAEGTQRSSPWTITVTTSGFIFLDGVNGSDTNVGTSVAPWKTLLKLYNSSTAGQIIYFRNGTYNLDGIPKNTDSMSGGWNNATWETSKANIWLAYPGHAPVIDNGFINTSTNANRGYNIRMSGHGMYLDGLTNRNYGNIAWQTFGGTYQTWRRLTQSGPRAGVSEGNAGTIMFVNPSSGQYAAWYPVIQDCNFSGGVNSGHIKMYSMRKTLIENNIFRDSASGFDVKQDIYQYEIRGNTFTNLAEFGVHGNYSVDVLRTSDGEIRYNLFNLPANDGRNFSRAYGFDMPPLHIYRNTIIGDIMDSYGNGQPLPINMYQNVIVNNDPLPTKSVRNWWVTTLSTYDLDGPGNEGANLMGNPADGIVDSNGNLTPAYSAYLGTRGHQIGDPSHVPSPPANLIVE